VCSIRVFAKNMGDPYYEPTIVVHNTSFDIHPYGCETNKHHLSEARYMPSLKCCLHVLSMMKISNGIEMLVRHFKCTQFIIVEKRVVMDDKNWR